MEPLRAIRILIADDHPIVREGLGALLECITGFIVEGKASDGQEAVELYASLKPDIALMDIKMPKMDGIQAMIRIRRSFPEAKIIILTTYMGEEDIFRSFQAGAKGYLLKDTPVKELEEAIRKVFAGQRHVPPTVASRLTERLSLSELTQRETEVLNFMAKGQSNKEIAASLGIGLSTVKTHVNIILTKLEVKSRTAAIAVAMERGILHP